MRPVMLITSASRGIGVAQPAAQRGYAVALDHRREREAAQALVERITATGGTAQAFAADVSVEEDVLRLFREVDQTFGCLDALVNNAGILERQMRLEDMDVARLQRVFAVNVTGTVLCCHEAVSALPESGTQAATSVSTCSIRSSTSQSCSRRTWANSSTASG